MSAPLGRTVNVAVVQHGNQYLIADGYPNRPGIFEILGSRKRRTGLRAVLDLHEEYEIPLSLHVSGTLIEAAAWWDPAFLEEIRDLVREGLVEIVGSSYAQNIMTLFTPEHNRWQLVEALDLYHKWLGAEPGRVKVFWPPERVWNTDRLAATVTDPSLPNGGYDYVLLDDRLLLPRDKRLRFDDAPYPDPELAQMHPILHGYGLRTLPLSTLARLCVPFQGRADQAAFSSLVERLGEVEQGVDPIIIYGDDMEKCAGIPPWDPGGVAAYEAFLRQIGMLDGVIPVTLGSWAEKHRSGEPRPVEPGTYKELARDFGAGESYRGWADSKGWKPYARSLERAERTVKEMHRTRTGSPYILNLATKHFAACTFETAWHDAAGSIHSSGGPIRPAPWAKALARHAAAVEVFNQASKWARENRPVAAARAEILDIDGDGRNEVILRNDRLAAVVTPEFGGRIVYLFALCSGDGFLVVGNPSDDWNWLEELNDYQDSPPNHPGALCDEGFEHDRYFPRLVRSKEGEGRPAAVSLKNVQSGSKALGMVKRFSLSAGSPELRVSYSRIPGEILPLRIGIGFSPDYLGLLREGVDALKPLGKGRERGFGSYHAALIAGLGAPSLDWIPPKRLLFGHGARLDVRCTADSCDLTLRTASKKTSVKERWDET